jgi:hypothetical protein
MNSRRAALFASVPATLGITVWLLRGEVPKAILPAPAGPAARRAPEGVPPSPRVTGRPELRPTAQPPPVAEVPPETSMPFARLMARTRDESRALYEAEEAAVGACMRSRGFEYEPNAFVGNEELEPPLSRYKPGDRDVAAAIGYGIAEDAGYGEVPIPMDVNEARVEKMAAPEREAWREALRGKDRPPPDLTRPNEDPDLVIMSIPSGPTVTWDRTSCLTQGIREVYGDDHAHMRAMLETNMAVNEVITRVENEPDYVAGIERWRQCMNQRGLSYPSPGAAAAQLQREFSEGKIDREALREKEITIATADADCFAQVGLAEVQRLVQSRMEQEVLANRGSSLSAYQRILTSALERAYPSPK